MGVAGEGAPGLPLALDGRHRELVEQSGDVGVLDAVGQDALAVDDLGGIAEPGEDDLARDAVEVSIAPSHRREQVVEPEIGDQRLVGRRQLGFELEVLVWVEQERFHAGSRAFRRS